MSEDTVLHPSFGMIGVHRVTSSKPQRLFDSPLGHSNFMEVTVHEAMLKRDLSRNWVHATKPLVRLMLTEAQWAQFITRPNVGDGVSCTLRWRHDIGPIESPPPDPDNQKTFETEYRQKIEESLQHLTDAINVLWTAKAFKSVSRSAVNNALDHIERAITHLRFNVPFVEKSFMEAVDRHLNNAKLEIEAHRLEMLRQLGLKNLPKQDDDNSE